ncbi:MAG: catalase family protein [Roseivirga sp.]
MSSNEDRSEPLLAAGTPDPKEAEYTQIIISRLKKQLDKVYGSKDMLRQFHAKMHGLLDAELIVAPELDDRLRQGLFTKETTYSCLIRLSNASSVYGRDRKRAIRGCAIRIQNEDKGPLQDFILTTNPIMAPGDVRSLKNSILALTGHIGEKLTYFCNPANWSDIWKMYKATRECTDLLNESYFSGSPYRFGEHQAVKFCIKPRTHFGYESDNQSSEHYLREVLVHDLAESEAQFDFMVQFSEDSKRQPIDDTSKEWKSQFHRVGTLKIPVQHFDTEARRTNAENMQFNPWNGLPEHQPLGAINRVRREVYSTLSAYRKSKN